MHRSKHARVESPNTNPFRVVAPRQGAHTVGIGMDGFHEVDPPKAPPARSRVWPRWVRGIAAVSVALAMAVFAALMADRGTDAGRHLPAVSGTATETGAPRWRVSG